MRIRSHHSILNQFILGSGQIPKQLAHYRGLRQQTQSQITKYSALIPRYTWEDNILVPREFANTAQITVYALDFHKSPPNTCYGSSGELYSRRLESRPAIK